MDLGFFFLRLAFFAAIVGLYTFALQRKINPSQLFYSVVLFALMLAYWPDISAPPSLSWKVPENDTFNLLALIKSTQGAP
jgi:hypothetical protein